MRIKIQIVFIGRYTHQKPVSEEFGKTSTISQPSAAAHAPHEAAVL
jgi:hypothetical protein